MLAEYDKIDNFLDGKWKSLQLFFNWIAWYAVGVQGL